MAAKAAKTSDPKSKSGGASSGSATSNSSQNVNRNAGATNPSAAGTSAAAGNSAIEMLKQDHRRVEGLFAQFKQSDDDEQKEGLVEQICEALILHMRLEESLFYPACREIGVESDTMDEAQVEHDGAKTLLNDLLESHSGSPFWEAKVTVLEELIKHHVAEEEKPEEGAFAQAEAHGLDDAALAGPLKARKEELQRRAAGKRPIRAVSVNQEENMPRYSERDDRGRFMSDDDDRDYGRARSRYEDDDRYGDSRRYERNGERSGSGWYGDSEGHSRAERSRGGESRYGGGYDEDERYGGRHEYDDRSGRERDERGRFMSDDDDDRRGARAGSYGGGGGSRGGHGGWSGDPRGHSEAARRGWESRGHEEDRRYGSRSGSGRDYGRDRDDGGRHEGHGGWFGDSRGHADASRRGWQHRR